MYFYFKVVAYFILTLVILGCSKRAETITKTEKVEQREDTIKPLLKETISFVEDTASFEEKLKKRFDRVFTGEIVFGDKTKASIKTPLKIGEPNHKTSTFYIRDDIQSIWNFQ